MRENLELFIRAAILAIALESLVWALFPSFMRRSMARLIVEPDNFLRALGLSGLVLAALLAFLFTWITR